jgi:hypothetical protein
MNVTSGSYDPGRLPVYYGRPTAPIPKKYECLRALATYVVVKWWDHALGRNKTPFPIGFVEKLERIVELGLPAFKVVGDYEPGFKLEEKG